MNSAQELFGQQRIVDAIGAQDSIGSPKQLLDTLSQAVTDFVCGAEQSDDLTMLAILYKGPAAGLAGK
jgi:sigma-B regulation protein RsbU (phosphoserine phosphatase)